VTFHPFVGGIIGSSSFPENTFVISVKKKLRASEPRKHLGWVQGWVILREGIQRSMITIVDGWHHASVPGNIWRRPPRSTLR